LAGDGGVGRASVITGQSVFYAGGGGGGYHGNNAGGPVYRTSPRSAGDGGQGGGGNGAQPTGYETVETVTASPGSANTGGGGGGAGKAGTLESRGGAGGSGVVILSYGANLEVTRTATAARAGNNFSQPLQVRAGNGSAEHDVTVAATGQVLRVGTSGTAVTSVTVRTVSGVATFTDLGFTSSVGAGARELTFTSDAFVGTTLTITPSQTASTVNITSSGTTTGVFANGNFESSTDGTANILNTDLVSAMTQGSVLVESFGDITVVNGFTSSTSGSDLSLKARGSISVNANQTIKTNGGDVIIWSDSDVSGGGVIRLLNNSEICTTSGTCGTATTGGGDIVLAGGAASTDAARPGGFAAGFGTTSNGTGTSTMTGVQIGTQQQAGQGARLYSAGGQITIRGAGATANSTDRPTAIDVLAASVINSGAGQIQIDAEYRSSNAGQRTIEFSAWGGGTTTITSTNNSSSAVVIRSNTAAGAATGNLGISANTTVFNVTGGLVFEAERINKSLNFTFNVSGPLVFMPYATTLLNESATTSFEIPSSIAFTSNPSSITVGSSTNTSPIIISENLQTTSGNIEILTSGAISKTTTTTLTAAADVVVTSRSSSIDMGSGAVSGSNIRFSPNTTYVGSAPLTASNGVISITGGSTVTLTGALQATGNILISGPGNITTSSAADISSTSGSVSITSTGASLTLDRSVSAATAISLTANRLALGATIGTTSASGVVTISPQSNSRVINLGTENSDHLSLTSSELNQVSAGTLRIGALNGSNSGNINVTAAIAPSGVSTLALRTTGTVESSGSGSITEVNLAISAAYIDLGGNNSITGNLALSSANATLNYNQISGSFTPATVDQVTADYGVATQILMSQVPTTSPVDRMMAVAFNPQVRQRTNYR
jgi:hypothetical protein